MQQLLQGVVPLVVAQQEKEETSLGEEEESLADSIVSNVFECDQKSLLHDLNMNVINSNQSTGHDKIHAMYNLLEIAGIDLEEMHYNWRRLVRLY